LLQAATEEGCVKLVARSGRGRGSAEPHHGLRRQVHYLPRALWGGRRPHRRPVEVRPKKRNTRTGELVTRRTAGDRAGVVSFLFRPSTWIGPSVGNVTIAAVGRGSRQHG